MSEPFNFGPNDVEYLSTDSVITLRDFRANSLFRLPVYTLADYPDHFYVKYLGRMVHLDSGIENWDGEFQRVSPEQDIEGAQARQRQFESTAQPNSASRYVKMASEANRRTLESTLSGRK